MSSKAEQAAMANGDALDMSQYRIDRLPKRERSTAEVWMARAGIPLAAAAFILFGFIWTPEFLVALNTESLPDQALERPTSAGTSCCSNCSTSTSAPAPLSPDRVRISWLPP